MIPVIQLNINSLFFLINIKKPTTGLPSPLWRRAGDEATYEPMERQNQRINELANQRILLLLLQQINHL